MPLSLAELRDGCYVLRMNVSDWEPEEPWRAYIHLTDVEAAFRTQKDHWDCAPSGTRWVAASKRTS